nr:transmembrane protein [Quercus suber]
MKFLNFKIPHSLSLLSPRRTYSFSSQKTQLNKHPLPHKTFFQSNTKDSLISHLCDQKRLREAVQLLGQIDQPSSASIYSNLIQLCVQHRALEEGKKANKFSISPSQLRNPHPSPISILPLWLTTDIDTMNPGQVILIGSTICVMLTAHFSVQLISEHLFHWKKPKEQKAIVIITLMAPIYAIDSFVGLLDFQGSKAFFMFLDSVKECYEALVIAKFLALMYSYLNISISKNIVPDEIKGRQIHHSFPMTLFQPHTAHLNHNTLKLLKYWTWQFVVIRPVCSILMITLQLLGAYPSWVSWTFTIILNISVSLALYSLVVFYHVFAKELAPHNPLAKFLCIKGIVFFCFWQGIVLDILVALGIIRSHHAWLDVEHIEEALQNLLVCVEMVFFAAFQQYAYNVAPYRDNDTSSVKLDKKKE